jgi:hypothetical protein
MRRRQSQKCDNMNYKEINEHFKNRVRIRIEKSLREVPMDNHRVDLETRSWAILGYIVILADENNLTRASEKLHEIKLRNPATADSMEDCVKALATAMGRFPTEFSLLHDRYRMMEQKLDCVEIIAQMELKMIESE